MIHLQTTLGHLQNVTELRHTLAVYIAMRKIVVNTTCQSQVGDTTKCVCVSTHMTRKFGTMGDLAEINFRALWTNFMLISNRKKMGS